MLINTFRRNFMRIKNRQFNNNQRKRRRRAKTIAYKPLTKHEIQEGIELYEFLDVGRPRFRSECADGPRPCPWVSCKYHLYLDVHPRTGSIKINFPEFEVWELPISCVLDIADQGRITLEKIGEIMNLTRERVRQLEASAATKLRNMDLAIEYRDKILQIDPDKVSDDADLDEYISEDSSTEFSEDSNLDEFDEQM